MVRITDIEDAGLIARTLRASLPELRARWPIGSLALFGSRIRGDARPGSDLDVLVTFDRPIPLSSFQSRCHRFSRWKIGFRRYPG
jgi:predicted nucleotidyltransferase